MSLTQMFPQINVVFKETAAKLTNQKLGNGQSTIGICGYDLLVYLDLWISNNNSDTMAMALCSVSHQASATAPWGRRIASVMQF